MRSGGVLSRYPRLWIRFSEDTVEWREQERAVNCPLEIIDQIGGWSKQSIGEGYRDGYQLQQLRLETPMNQM